VGDINVVRPNGDLALKGTGLVEDSSYDGLLRSSASLSRGAALNCLSGASQFGEITHSPAHGLPRSTEEVFGGGAVSAQALPSEAARVGTAAQWDVSVPKIFTDGSATVAAFVRELQQASAFQIEPDEVVSVRDVFAKFVHVYDLQSLTGWLLASNIVCSNCRCVEVYRVTRAAAA
jgi:hypothetical protein